LFTWHIPGGLPLYVVFRGVLDSSNVDEMWSRTVIKSDEKIKRSQLANSSKWHQQRRGSNVRLLRR